MKNKVILLAVLAGITIIGYKLYMRFAPDATDHLFAAIRTNDLEAAKKAIAEGADVNEPRGMKVGSFPLQKAIEHGNSEMVTLLLKNNAAPIVSNAEKTYGAYYMFDALDYSVSLALGYSSSTYAPLQNQKAIIRQLLKIETAVTNYTAIVPTIMLDDLIHVKELTPLIKQGIEEKKVRPDRLARAALFSEDKKMIDYVFSNLLNNQPDDTGDRVKYAIELNNEEFLDYVFNHSQTNMKAVADNNYFLYDAVKLRGDRPGNITVIKKLLSMGANPSGKKKWSPLNRAISFFPFGPEDKEHLEVVKTLLDAGANVNDQSEYSNRTPLMQAVLYGHPKIVEMLLKAGANPDRIDKNNKTARDLARRKGYSAIVKLIDEASAQKEKNEQNKMGSKLI